MIKTLSSEGFAMICDQQRHLAAQTLYLSEWLQSSPNIHPFEFDFWESRLKLMLEVCENYGKIIEVHNKLKTAAALN